MEKHDDVETVNLNYRAEAYTIPNDPYYSSQWGHENTGQAVTPNGNTVGTVDSDTDTDLAWDITQGSEDITIAIIDTGVNGNHEEFQGKMVPGYDFVDNDTDASDGNMHGTACAGIAAAQGNNGVGIAGVALLLYLLAVHRSPSTITFAVVVVIMVAGLIFDPEVKE
mgnify:CR=1 FL=1